MNNNNETVLKKADHNDVQILADYQNMLAQDTEGISLNMDDVKDAIKHLLKNQQFGFFVLAQNQPQNKNQKQHQGSVQIEETLEAFQNQGVWWFESVYVEQQFRQNGIFRKLFEYIEEKAQKLDLPLKLYVETENERAMKVYQKMGMYDTGEIFLEADFYFEDKESFKETKEYEFKVLDIENQQDIQELLEKNDGFVSLFEKKSVSKELLESGLEQMKNKPGYGIILQVRNSQGELVGAIEAFFEFSMWRNGLTVLISDIRMNQKLIEQQQQGDESELVDFLSGLFYSCKNIIKFDENIQVTCIRIVIDEQKRIISLIKKAGLQQAHYRIYQKD
ncbi:Acyl-CoA N-acyltransferase [Pseudocohnilembus persalinus]|uniref:Acyl-CoA N-acyltransferase n=1 Tax=Pseudocohnilembus persalinus TaxID=266149 RepID=A0A0V0Q7W4_PSEPJ|nr:Acyl-CoA N-acyltransferase [Pseudocohnilembus persalinus]|eukprot:KRW98333.1 Acyl-CoA N-acyltransferase [Pseudocohnilembus persalinus]